MDDLPRSVDPYNKSRELQTKSGELEQKSKSLITGNGFVCSLMN
jgi:hypothetical protein